MFNQLADAQATLNASLGPLAALIILALCGVIIYLNKLNQKLQTDIRAIQDQRIVDAKETRDKLTEPLAQIARMSEQIYELVLDGRKGK